MTRDIWGSRVWLLEQYTENDTETQKHGMTQLHLDLNVSKIKVNTLLQKMENLS